MTRKASCAGAFPSCGHWSTGRQQRPGSSPIVSGSGSTPVRSTSMPSRLRADAQSTLTGGGSPRNLQSLRALFPWRLSRRGSVRRPGASCSTTGCRANGTARWSMAATAARATCRRLAVGERWLSLEVLRWSASTLHPSMKRLTSSSFARCCPRAHAEAEHQIDASVKLFQSEGVDPASLKSAFAAAQRSVSKPAGMSLVDITHLDSPSARQVARTRGPTILVMPFAAAAPEDVADADSLTSDIIFGVAKLRSISIIARGTAFSLRGQTPAAAAALVNAQYVVSGHLRRDGKNYLVSVELSDPRSGRIFGRTS